MDFSLSEQEELFVKGVRDFARGEIAPLSKQMDEDGIIDQGLLQKLKEQGFFALSFPEEYGGVGLNTLTYGLVIAELAKVDAGVAIMVGVHNSVGSYPVLRFGSEELKKRVLPEMAKGHLGSFCVTEPGAGSDAASISTRADTVDGGYVLNGEKIWVTNGYHSRFFVVLARLDGQPGHHGISAFLVERDNPGLSVGAKEDKMGLRSSDCVSVVFDGVKVSGENLIGEKGQGFEIAMASLDGGRIGVAYQAIGLGEACLDAATAYAQEREQFGRPIAQQQAIQWMLADTATELEQSSLLAHKAATLKDQGKPFSRLAAMAKYSASEMANRAADRAVQIHGGYGYSKDYPVERYYRDARVLRIYEGTNEIQKMVIARRVLQGEH